MLREPEQECLAALARHGPSFQRRQPGYVPLPRLGIAVDRGLLDAARLADGQPAVEALLQRRLAIGLERHAVATSDGERHPRVEVFCRRLRVEARQMPHAGRVAVVYEPLASVPLAALLTFDYSSHLISAFLPYTISAAWLSDVGWDAQGANTDGRWQAIM